MNRYALLIGIVTGITLVPTGATADTGTYEISEYRVTLVPLEDGVVEITYYQEWRVTGGNIPWITVGTANRRFTVLPDSAGGSARSVTPKSSGNWSGVHIALDREYLPGEIFEVSFKIRQRGLFYQADTGYRLDFIPGWYDRGKIGNLTVALEFFTELTGVSAGPEPSETAPQQLVWERTNLQPGERFRVGVTFPPTLFPDNIELAETSPYDKQGGSRVSPVVGSLLFFAFLVVIVVILFVCAKGGRGSDYGGGGNVSIAGIHAATGGRVVSCACACVACACACACAGGGAAGCDRKLTRTCPLCAYCEEEDCPLRTGTRR